MRELIRLKDRYPGVSRMTRWRWKRQPDFPEPVVIGGSEYFVSSELTDFEERRRAKRERAGSRSANNNTERSIRNE